MDTSTCSTIVLVLLWLYLCCNALGFLAGMIEGFNTDVLSSTSTISTALLGVCLWQCKKAGYFVSPMTWYHWVLLVLLVLLQIIAWVLEYQGWGLFTHLSITSTYPIYGVAAALMVVLGGTLFCGWKCNLFCRPCCKSQYICYGSAIVAVLVVLIALAVTASLPKETDDDYGDGAGQNIDHNKGGTMMQTIGYLGNMLIPITQIYAMAVIWNTMVKPPYTVPEVMVLISSALTVASILALAVPSSTEEDETVLSSTIGYPVLAVHLASFGITLYLLEYKRVFYWPKDYLCFGLLAVVLVVALASIVVAYCSVLDDEAMKYTLLGYSFLLMVPTLWYAYRCGLLKWCLPPKKGLKATNSAENTVPETDIAKV